MVLGRRLWNPCHCMRFMVKSPLSHLARSLCGRCSKGKGKGIQGTRPRAREEVVSFLPRAPHVLSRAQIPPSPSPFNACHAGYLARSYVTSQFKTAQNAELCGSKFYHAQPYYTFIMLVSSHRRLKNEIYYSFIALASLFIKG